MSPSNSRRRPIALALRLARATSKQGLGLSWEATSVLVDLRTRYLSLDLRALLVASPHLTGAWTAAVRTEALTAWTSAGR